MDGAPQIAAAIAGSRQVTREKPEAAAGSGPLDDAEYEAIEAAVRATARGRAFLDEFAQRNKSLNTAALLKSISKLQLAHQDREPTVSLAQLRNDIMEVVEDVALTRRDIAAMPAAKETESEAGGEIDSIVGWAEKATSDILGAAEQIQEIAWTLREKGIGANACDELDARATDIYTACSFQDLTSRRIGSAIAAFEAIENRLHRLVEIWRLDDVEEAPHEAPAGTAEQPQPAGDESLELFDRLAANLKAAMHLSVTVSPDTSGQGEGAEAVAEAEAEDAVTVDLPPPEEPAEEPVGVEPEPAGAADLDEPPPEDPGDEQASENPDLACLSQAHKSALFS